VPTARSWTDAPARHVTEARRAVADVGHLLRFRAGSVRRPLALALGLTLFTVLTLSAAVVPGLLPGAGSDDGRARDVLVLLPTSFAAVVVIALVSAVASGGGRELIARDPAAVHPVSPTTDHLGALLLAPLNVAWLLQAWGLLGATAFAVGWPRLAAAQVGVVLWLALATAVAQVVAWALEGVRRSWHGDAALRVATAACLASAIALQLADELVPLLDRLPTLEVVLRIAFGFSWDWAVAVAALLVALLAAVALGAVPAHVVARRVPREEVRAESGVRRWRPAPRSDVTALLRVDRASVWRAVPIRRGIAVLAIGLAGYQLYRRQVRLAVGILVAAAVLLAVYASIDRVPGDFTNITPYVITLLVLAFASQRLRMPAADGQVYRKGSAG